MNTERANHLAKMKVLDEAMNMNPLGAKKLRLPDQSSGVGYQTPSEKRLQDAIEKRYGKPSGRPDSTDSTSFSRGIPGCE